MGNLVPISDGLEIVRKYQIKAIIQQCSFCCVFNTSAINFGHAFKCRLFRFLSCVAAIFIVVFVNSMSMLFCYRRR